MSIKRACLAHGRITCLECSKPKRDKRPGARQRGYDNEWQRTRGDYLSYFPACQHPKGCLRPATDVHHLDGLGPKGPRGHDWGNLQGLCHSHHSQLTAKETPAGWNAQPSS